MGNDLQLLQLIMQALYKRDLGVSTRQIYIVSFHLYSTSHSGHQSEALPLSRLGGTDAVINQSIIV